MKKLNTFRPILGLTALLALACALLAPERAAAQPMPPAIYTNLPWTWVTNSATWTFPVTNNLAFPLVNGGYGANSNFVSNVTFTNGITPMYRGRGLGVWIAVSPTNSTATNTVVTAWHVAPDNTLTTRYTDQAPTGATLTNAVNAAGTNISFVYLPFSTLDNAAYAKLLSLQLIQTNSSVQLGVWSTIFP
jgi:hypothetical protein